MERRLTHLIDKALSRRTFLAGASATVAGGLFAGCSDPAEQVGTPTPTPTAPTAPAYADADYLNFALNLEYLEAEFYLRAATGTGLGSADTGNTTTKTTGGSMVALTGTNATVQQQYLYEIAQNELDHVRFLRAALGSAAVPAPAIDLTNSFNALAQQAAVGNSFTPFDTYADFLIGAFIFEDVGVTAYHGAATLLSKGSPYLTPAAEIHAVEAYHAASIRSQIIAYDAANGTSLTAIAKNVSTLRGDLGGGAETAPTATTIVAANPTTSIGYKRTTDQVLHIVYGTALSSAGTAYGVKSGGFFPSGLNGNISQTYS